MITQLPHPIVIYFAISNGADTPSLSACFAPDATVTDEGHTHRGIPAIQAWLDAARKKYAYTIEPLNARHGGDHFVVVGRVSGSFHGSPVEITHTFVLAGDLIQSLEIHA